MVDRGEVAHGIARKLASESDRARRQWRDAQPVRHMVFDDLLDEQLLDRVVEAFPSRRQMRRLATIREHKCTTQKAGDWGAACREVMLAFQDDTVLQVLENVTGIRMLRADPEFWASGLSRMDHGDFLNPHLDNSGHASIVGYRRLNALFYVSRGWSADDGGSLELWSRGLRDRVEIPARFNRLVVMNTDRRSWHSVNRVRCARARLCLSNYYYTRESPEQRDYSHITSFRGRPGQPLRDLYLRAEAALGTVLVRTFPRNPNRS